MAEGLTRWKKREKKTRFDRSLPGWWIDFVSALATWIIINRVNITFSFLFSFLFFIRFRQTHYSRFPLSKRNIRRYFSFRREYYTEVRYPRASPRSLYTKPPPLSPLAIRTAFKLYYYTAPNIIFAAVVATAHSQNNLNLITLYVLLFIDSIPMFKRLFFLSILKGENLSFNDNYYYRTLER